MIPPWATSGHALNSRNHLARTRHSPSNYIDDGDSTTAAEPPRARGRARRVRVLYPYHTHRCTFTVTANGGWEYWWEVLQQAGDRGSRVLLACAV